MDHLNTHARHAVDEAEAVARRLAHHYVGTEHLLAGLAHTAGGGAQRALARCGLDAEEVEAQVEALLGRGRHALTVRPPFTASADLAMARSRWEARALGRDAVATGHLLLAVLHQADSTAATVLQGLGIDPVRLETVVVEAGLDDGVGHPDAGTAPPDPLGPVAPTAPSGPGAVVPPGDDPGTVPAGLPAPAGLPVPSGLPAPAGAGPDPAPAGVDDRFRPDPDEPLAVQVVRLSREVARLQREVGELTALVRVALAALPSPADGTDPAPPPLGAGGVVPLSDGAR